MYFAQSARLTPVARLTSAATSRTATETSAAILYCSSGLTWPALPPLVLARWPLGPRGCSSLVCRLHQNQQMTCARLGRRDASPAPVAAQSLSLHAAWPLHRTEVDRSAAMWANTEYQESEFASLQDSRDYSFSISIDFRLPARAMLVSRY